MKGQGKGGGKCVCLGLMWRTAATASTPKEKSSQVALPAYHATDAG